MTDQAGSQGVSRRQVLRQSLAGAGALAVAPLAGVVGPLAVGGGPPAIITRAQWGADEALRGHGPEFAPIRRAIVHHTVTPTNEPDSSARVRAIYRYHVVNRRWSDIAYNFLVDGAGRIYEGRWARSYGAGEVHDGEDGGGRGVIGSHARGHNTGSLGIAVLGTYNHGHTGPTDAALGAVAVLVAWKLGARSIDPRAPGAFVGHRDVTSTGCPGDGVHQRLPELRDRAAALAGGGTTGGGGLLDQLLDLVLETPDVPLLGGS
ncbi:MAG TPA: peptidoglycan recognition protein [Acidimicrobiales bacterium]|nr:peptidoglycan recognition protein [Acidimicrobiales bacterium]